MTHQQKIDIVELIKVENTRLGSAAKTAKKCGCSEGTISQIVNHNWTLISEAMWTKIGAALGYRPQGWQIVPIANTLKIWQYLDIAKEQSLFLPIAHRGGSGKTTSLKTFEGERRDANVFYLSCREWAKREFLTALAQSIGIDGAGKAQSIDSLLMSVVGFFQQRAAARPMLILDEADKLKGAALRTLITLYNECEGGLAVVISGTDHLEKQMVADARHNRKGAEELLSRFGRKFIHLNGATRGDVENICKANGVTDAKTIKTIFQECEPVRRLDGEVVEDLRRVRRCVEREILRQEAANEVQAEAA